MAKLGALCSGIIGILSDIGFKLRHPDFKIPPYFLVPDKEWNGEDPYLASIEPKVTKA